MTAENKEAGAWGGLAIAGYGKTNAGEDVTSEVADLTVVQITLTVLVH